MLTRDPETLLFRLIALLAAATVHEYAHAWMADRLGDPTPRMLGRLSLNPIVHLDLLGSILLLVAGFGWAKPVPINPRHFSDWRRGLVLVAAAGPLANITLLFLIGVLFQINLVDFTSVVGRLLLVVISINAILAIFNLLPIPPLDGSKILSGLLPPAQSIAYDRLQPYGPILLLALVFLAPGVIGLLVVPPVNWLISRATGLGLF